MTYQAERDQFMHEAARNGLNIHQARTILRHATTLQRIAVAACNGDYPCDNGERKTIACPVCESGYVPSAIQGGPLARAAYGDHQPGCMTHLHRPCNCIKRKARACPDCRTAAAVRAVLDGSGLTAEFFGDPRGAVLRLFPKDTPREDISNGRARGIYVPVRER